MNEKNSKKTKSKDQKLVKSVKDTRGQLNCVAKENVQKRADRKCKRKKCQKHSNKKRAK